MMSLASSKPTDRRIVSVSAPAACRCSSDSCECIIDAGCAMSVRLSPRFATREIICTLSTSALPASYPPLRPKVKSAPAPFGQYFWCKAKLLPPSPAYRTHFTFGCFSKNRATSSVLSQCFCIRKGSVSMPIEIKKALKGLMHIPMSRSPRVLAAIANAMPHFPFVPMLSATGPSFPNVSYSFTPWYDSQGSDNTGNFPDRAQSKSPFSTTKPPIALP
mmetsp:Transcript_84409/g.257747  ORF Transcript_84409/g.257747 Transcript_84409/m.257747 type:complete len:218 (-) Transcript_84409:779-1432(-)